MQVVDGKGTKHQPNFAISSYLILSFVVCLFRLFSADDSIFLTYKSTGHIHIHNSRLRLLFIVTVAVIGFIARALLQVVSQIPNSLANSTFNVRQWIILACCYDLLAGNNVTRGIFWSASYFARHDINRFVPDFCFKAESLFLENR